MRGRWSGGDGKRIVVRMVEEHPIKQARKRAKLSQAKLALAMGTTEATISRYESGKITPPNAVLQKMAVVLQVEPGELSGQIPFMTDDERRLLAIYRSATDAIKEAVRAVLRAAEPGDGDREEHKNLRETKDND